MRLLWLVPLASIAFAQPSPHNESQALLWGPYRPNLYFGLRPRLPQSLMTGLLWFGANDYTSISKTRHACDTGDDLDSYTWTDFDARRGGVQVIKDGKNNVKLTTEFLKVPGGRHGGSWAARIKGEPINPAAQSSTSVIFYAGLEGLGGLDMETDEQEDGYDSDLVFAGSSPDLDDFTLRIVDGQDSVIVNDGPHIASFAARAGKTHIAGFRIPSGDVWMAKDWIMQDIVMRAQPILKEFQSSAEASGGFPHPAFVLQLSDDVLSGSNLYAIQKTFDGPFEFDIFFESKSAGPDGKLSAATLDAGIPALVASVDSCFESTFPITPSSLPASADLEGLRAFSKDITANVLGGVGYFYGTSIVDKGFAYEWDEDDEQSIYQDAPEGDDTDDDGFAEAKKGGARLTEPRALLTATPSRSFFPRGFYWDEGFHLLHIGPWDTDLSIEILKDWVGLIDDDGWVGREQILGEEARSKVPAEFQAQIPTNANPPTLTMAVTALIARLRAAGQAGGPTDAELGMDFGMNADQVPLSSSSASSSVYLNDPQKAREFVRSIYGPLKRHYEWFRRTQRGQIKQYGRTARSRSEAYRWRGRSATHVLTSGMDDYPRGPPHAGELHVDLISWMAFFSRTMKDIAGFVGEHDDEASYAEIEKAIIGNIDDLHWNEEQQMYCDAGINDEDESQHVCNKGYLSLFPFMLSLLDPSSPHLGPILDLLSDPEQLWSPYGIRSLSLSHPEFGQGENYWKGPIWMPMNYMILSALHKTYGAQLGPNQNRAREIYTELRQNVIQNVFKEYQRTGYVWEQYDAVSGEGRRSHPFTGWTSLLTLILAETY